MDRRRLFGFGAALAAASLATGCAGREKITARGLLRSLAGKGLGKTGNGGA